MKKLSNIIGILLAGIVLFSCEKPIVVDRIDESAYDNVTSLVATLRDVNTNKLSPVVEMRKDPFSSGIAVNLSRPAGKGVEVTVSYDAAYLETYNQEHETSFALYPKDKLTLPADGKITVAPDEMRSYTLPITLDPVEGGEEATYVLPLKATVSTDGVTMSEQDHLVYLVKDLSWQADASRADGEKHIISWLEVNNTNPLNMLQFETEDGRLLTDYVVLFAYNINYNRETGEVYVFANPQCQFILDHYDQMIKPLRERGIKVIVSILGNHDESGLAQLSDLGCREFARKVAALVNAYGFDGVDYDDEYSNSPDLSNPLFASKSQARGNRLYFETKKLLPDKLMVSYQYGSALGNAAVDGVDPSEYMDIFNGDYGRAGVPYGNASLSACSYQSTEFAQGRYRPTASTASAFAASEYGFWMTFSLWNTPGKQADWVDMNYLSEAVYGSPLKKPAVYYGSTTSLESSPIQW